jgi:hypothetical protein
LGKSLADFSNSSLYVGGGGLTISFRFNRLKFIFELYVRCDAPDMIDTLGTVLLLLLVRSVLLRPLKSLKHPIKKK